VTGRAEKAALLALAKAAERALHDSERARQGRDAVEYLRARRRCAAFLESLILRLADGKEDGTDAAA
jgi:hypothetical protein